MRGIIKVALFEDIFWNNNSEIYPCNVPSDDLYIEIDDVQPKFITPYSATCILEGEYNAAIYNGVYYQLKKMEMHDTGINPEHQIRYKYQLEYDVMMNFLSHGGRIKGTVIRTNNEEWLSKPEVLQTCKPVLEEPCRMVYGRFDDTEFSWQKLVRVYYPPSPFKQTLPTKQAYEAFINYIAASASTGRAQGTNAAILENDVVILGYIDYTESVSWKQNIIDLIKEQYESLENFQLVKVSQLTGSPLMGKLAISHKSHSIGTTEETFQGLTKIDLSRMTDIVPLSLLTLEKAKPIHKPQMSDLIDRPVLYRRPETIYYAKKLARTPYLPLRNFRNDIEKEAYLPIEENLGDWQLYNTNYSGYKDNRPQKIEFTEDSGMSSDVGYLWWVDRLDFCLAGRLYDKPYTGDNPHEYLWYRSMPEITGNYYWQNLYIFRQLPLRQIPPVGFLMFDIDRPHTKWYTHTYTGDTPLKTIRYRSGLSRTLPRYYGDETGRWWSRLTQRGKEIRGAKELSFLSYDTDLWTWLYFAPKDNRYYYAYHYYDFWGFNKVYGSANYYTPKIVARDIVVNGRIEVVNPYHPTKIEDWLTIRYNKIDSVSIYTDITLPKEIRKGDIFVSSLTHKFTNNNLLLDDHVDLKGRRQVQAGAGTITALGVPMLLLPPPANIILATINLTLGGLWSAHIADNLRILGYNNLHLKDMFQTKTISIEDVENKTIFFVQNGTFFIGELHTFTRELELAKDELQIVKSVEGQTKTTVKFYHIRKLGYDEAQGKDNQFVNYVPGTPLTTLQKEEILVKTLSAAYDGDGVFIHNYTKERLKGADTVQLFDLVNTDWYAYVQGGRVHLISKKNEDFFTDKPQYSRLTLEDVKGVPIYDKINQKATLSVYGTVKQLNTKFNLENDVFNILITPFLFEDQTSITEYFHVISENPYDYLNEMVETPKKTTKATAEVSVTQLEQLKLQLRQQNQSYYFQKLMNDLTYREKIRKFAWDREDLNMQLANNIIGAVGAGLEAAALTVIPGVIGGKHLHSLFVPVVPKNNGSYAVSKQTLMTGKYGRGLTATAIRAISAAPFFHYYPSFHNRINENEKTFIEKNALEMLSRDMAETHNYQKMVQQLNELTSAYVKREVNERAVLEQLNKTGVHYVHLEVFLPSTQQSEQLKRIFEVYGVECNIPDCELEIGRDLCGTIVQFASLAADSIQSELTRDINIRESVKMLFENGLRFVYHEHIPCQPISRRKRYASFRRDQFDLSSLDLSTLTGEEWHRLTITVSKDDLAKKISSTDKYGLTDEEYNKYKDKLSGKDPLDSVIDIIEKRGSGITIDIVPESHPEDTITELQLKIKEAEQEKQKLEQEKEKLEQEIEARKLSSKLAADKTTDLERQLKECIRDKTNILQAKDTCDLINTQKIKELEKKLKDKDEQIEIFNKQIDKATIDARVMEEECNKTLRRYLDEKDKLIADHKKELEEAKKGVDQTELDDLKQKLKETSDELTTYQVLAYGLEQELKQTKETVGLPKEQKDQLYKTLKEVATNYGRDWVDEVYDKGADMDIGLKSDGSNNIRSSIISVLEELTWMRKTNFDTLITNKYHQMRPVINGLMRLQEVPIISEWQDVINMPGWSDYKTYLLRGGAISSEVQKVITAINGIKLRHENQWTWYGLQTLFGRIFWDAYVAWTELKEQMKTDEDLQYFYKHIFPADSRFFLGRTKEPNKLFFRHYVFNKAPLDVATNTDSFVVYDQLIKKPMTEYEEFRTKIGDINKQRDRKIPQSEFVPSYKNNPLSIERSSISARFFPIYPSNAYYVNSFSTYKHRYSSQSKRYSFIYLKTSDPDSKNHSGLYLSVDSNNIWPDIITNWNLIWRSRKRTTPPSSIPDTLKGNIKIRYLRIDMLSNGYPKILAYTHSLNLYSIFGEKYFWDALVILMIMSSNRLASYIDKTDSDGYTWHSVKKILTNTLALEQNEPPFSEFLSGEISEFDIGFFNLVCDDLSDNTNSFLNYIWRHIKLDLDSFEDPWGNNYTNIGKFNIRTILNRIWRENKN